MQPFALLRRSSAILFAFVRASHDAVSGVWGPLIWLFDESHDFTATETFDDAVDDVRVYPNAGGVPAHCPSHNCHACAVLRVCGHLLKGGLR